MQGGLTLAGFGLTAGCTAPFQLSRTDRQVRIAVISPAAIDPSPEGRAFRQELADLGYVEGKNLVVIRRFSNSKNGLAAVAAEVVQLDIDLIVAVENRW